LCRPARRLWALGGKTDTTTVHGEKAGDWSAVIVRDGSPQLIGIWLATTPRMRATASAWLAAIEFADIRSPELQIRGVRDAGRTRRARSLSVQAT
jgi:hypothetical protein